MSTKKPKRALSSVLVALANGESVAPDTPTVQDSGSNSPFARMNPRAASTSSSPDANSTGSKGYGRSSAPSGVAYAVPLFSQYPSRHGRDHLTVPIKAQNVVFERPKVIKSLSSLDDGSASIHAPRKNQGPQIQVEPQANSAQILGARVTNVQPINSSRAAGAADRWGRQLQDDEAQETSADLSVLGGSALDELLSPERILEKSHTYERSHVYEKAGRKSQDQTVVSSMEEVQTATASSSGPSFLGQSAKALLKAQSTPRDLRDKTVEATGVFAAESFGVPQVILGSSRDTKQKKKDRPAVPPQERLLSGAAKLLMEYFTPFLQESDLVITDVRLQLERVPLVVVRPHGGLILGVLCEDSFDELVDNPRLLLSYGAQLQRYRQRLAESMSAYLHLHIYQGLTLFDSMTGFICLERLSSQQVRKLIQFCSAHRILKERRELIKLFTDQKERLRVMCPLDGMYQYCHNYLEHNFHRQVIANTEQGEVPTGASKAFAASKISPFDNGDHTLEALNLAEAFSNFLQLQVDSGSGEGEEVDSKENQRETLRQLQDYLQDAHLVREGQQEASANSGEIWLGQCQSLRSLQARGSAPDLFARVPLYTEDNKTPTHRLDWDKIVRLSRYINHSYQPSLKAVRVYVPNQELLSNPSIVTPRPNLQPVPDVGQRNRTPAARPLATQGVAQDPASMKRMDEPSLPQSQNLALPEVAPESVQTAAQVEQQRARRARAAHIQARKAMMGHSGPSGQGRGQRAHGVRAQGVTPQRGNHQAMHRAQVASAPLAHGAQYGGQMHGYNQPSQEVPLGANRPMSPMQPNQQAYQASQMSLPPNLEQSAPVQGRTAYSPAQSFQRQGQSRPYMQPDVGQSAVLNQGQQASRPQGQQGGNSAFAQSIAVPSANYVAQQARYREAAALGRNVGAPLINSDSYAANPALQEAVGDDYSMDFSLRPPLSGSTFTTESQFIGSTHAPATMTSVSVADVNFFTSGDGDQADDLSLDQPSSSGQMQWDGALPVAVATMNLGGGYDPMQMAQRLMSGASQGSVSNPVAQPAAAQPHEDDEESVDALVQAALEADPQH